MGMYKNILTSGAALLLGTSLLGCEPFESDDEDKKVIFKITSASVEPWSELPDIYTCADKEFGAGIAPQLTWTEGPEGTLSYVVLFKDLSLEEVAPDYAYHWAIWDIPATARSIPEGLPTGAPTGDLEGAVQLSAGPGGGATYFGPCPSWGAACPSGTAATTDTYAFNVYAMGVAAADFPADDPEIANPVREMEAYFLANALNVAQLVVTSDAMPGEAPDFCPEPEEAAE